jgi:thiamine pyrophosphate-dependent acetolactate synthase large subunit-like protein
MTKDEALAPLLALRRDEVVVTTMGTVRPWGERSSSPLDFASADSAMGHAADLALGVALARPERKVICLNGDGSMLMTLGTLVTAAENRAANLILFVIDNGTYEITGNQPVPGGGRVDWAAMARAAGFPRAHAFDAAAPYAAALPQILRDDGPTLVALRVEPGRETPLGRGPHEAAAYLRGSLADEAHRLRRALTTHSRS